MSLETQKTSMSCKVRSGGLRQNGNNIGCLLNSFFELLHAFNDSTIASFSCSCSIEVFGLV